MFEVHAESPVLVISVTAGQEEPDFAGFHK
jgi:hypothetical protein